MDCSTKPVVTVKPAVVILALDTGGSVHLVRQFRYAPKTMTLEACAGAIDEGETPLSAAKRELLEELGIRAKKWTKLGNMYPFTSVVQAPQTLFLAQELSFATSQPEGTEVITPVAYSFHEALQMAMDGRIMHASTCALLLRAAKTLNAIDTLRGFSQNDRPV